MCCLKNEEDVYEELNRKMPGVGDFCKAKDGLEGEVSSVNILRQTLKILVEVDDEKEVHEYKLDEIEFFKKKQKKKNNNGKKSAQEAEEMKELEALPVRLLFTTRCRFSDVRSLCVENLDHAAALQMLRAAMPAESEEDLKELAEAVGCHTLTLRILTDTARESKGRLRASRLLETLARRFSRRAG